MLWCALLLPDPALQVFCRADASDAPLAVVDPAPPGRVVAANAPARTLGVRGGQRLAGALALAPALRICPRRADLENALLHETATWAGRFTPRVSLDGSDGLLCEISASLLLFQGLESLLDALGRDAAELGLRLNISTAPTPLAARWLARHQPGRHMDSHHPDWPSLLDTLPLACLADVADAPPAAGASLPRPVSADTLALLAGLGLAVLGDLARLPRDGLAQRQAAAVSELLARARGERPDPRPPFEPPAHYQARLALPTPTAHAEALQFAARRLLNGMEQWLAARQAGVEHCTLWLEYEGVRKREKHADLPIELQAGTPGRDSAVFLLLLREHLQAHPLAAPVDAMRLQAPPPRPLQAPQHDLFGAHPGAGREAAVALLARLRARLGEDAVSGIAPHAEHRPEQAWRPAQPGRAVGMAALPAAPRPGWLLHEPRRLPRLAPLRLLRGPERIESGWWDGTDVRRDYWVASAPDGRQCWLYEDLRDGGWYLHGYFG